MSVCVHKDLLFYLLLQIRFINKCGAWLPLQLHETAFSPEIFGKVKSTEGLNF